jgi:hypothetical protein
MVATLVHEQAAGLDMEGRKMNIKELAEQAGFIVDKDSQKYQRQCIQSTHSLIDEPLAKFAELVAAHEREECAKFCETNQVWVGQGKRGFSKWGEENFVAGGRHQGMDYADAIRARSKA